MKYVSPVCEVEVLETKDIMAASTNVAGVTVFGNVEAVNHSASSTFDVYEQATDADGKPLFDEKGNAIYTDTVIGSGFGLSLDFSKLS
jgi:hypothetical protein